MGERRTDVILESKSNFVPKAMVINEETARRRGSTRAVSLQPHKDYGHAWRVPDQGIDLFEKHRVEEVRRHPDGCLFRVRVGVRVRVIAAAPRGILDTRNTAI